jgi:hypothetical protein
MRGPAPKPAGLRQRRNKVTTAATLPSVEDSKSRKIPALPKREGAAERWHPKAEAWWKSFWRSPMAAEVQDSDKMGGLYLAAEALHRAWASKEDTLFLRFMEAFHKMMTEFGGSPIARRRLQWQIDQGEAATERTERRRKGKVLEKVSKQDPRDVLRIA